MTLEQTLLEETLRSIFDRHWTQVDRLRNGDSFPTDLWTLLDGAGLTALGAQESGASLSDLVVVAREIGRVAAPLPIVEMSGLASWLLDSAGFEPIAGIVGCPMPTSDDLITVVSSDEGWIVDGRFHEVPWGRNCNSLVTPAQTDTGTMVLCLPAPDKLIRHVNLAGEPRDTLIYTGTRLGFDSVRPARVDNLGLRDRGALLRAATMVGAMETLLNMSIAHASERVQFGRPIISFTPVQDHLVIMAEEVAASRLAVDAATMDPTPISSAIAKLTANEAAEVVAARSHQVHGAIGATIEHSLHHFTKRLWAWQSDFGSSDSLSEFLGADILGGGAENLWPNISRTIG
jgi:acyl-CoA dehydrogenase